MEWNDKQKKILDIAEELFAINGFDGTSIRQISKAADINVAMISYYFGSKQKLLQAIVAYRNTGFREEFEDIIVTELSYLEKLDQIVSLVISRIHKNRRIYKIVHFLHSNNEHNFDFEIYNAQKKENFKTLKDFITNGQKEGSFVEGVDYLLFASNLRGAYFSLYFNKSLFMSVLDLKDDTGFEKYIFSNLIPHVQRTARAVLTYNPEKK